MTWEELGMKYPGKGAAARAVFDVLAPQLHKDIKHRSPVYECGHETTPDPGEVWDLSKELAGAVRKALKEKL